MKAPKLIFRIFSCIVISLTAMAGARSQTGYFVHVDSVHCLPCPDPICGLVDLNGYITYDISVLMEPGDCLTGIFGDLNDLTPNPDCYDGTQFEINFDGLVFNHYLPSGPFGTSQLCFLYPTYPCMQWDSYLTLCQDCNTDPGTIFELMAATCGDTFCPLINQTSDCAGLFNNCDAYSDQGGWFAPPGTIPCASADATGMVQIAQITTNDCFDMHFYYAYQPGCIPGTPIETVEVDFQQCNPCTANPMDTSLVANAALCPGLDPGLLLDDGGNGPITYELYDGDNGIDPGNIQLDAFISDTGVAYTDVTEGCYYFTMVDSVGCRDTTNIACFSDPLPLTFDATLLTDNLCFGDAVASIGTACSGGTGAIDIQMDGPGSTWDETQPCGFTFTDLGCVGFNGDYTLTATDDNGCSLDTTISVSCPENLLFDLDQVDITCFGNCTGEINGTVIGGTDPVDVTWLFNGNPYNQFTGNSTFDISLENLCAGTYDVAALDSNACQINANFEITQPDSITIDVTITDVSCFGLCDGVIDIDTEGGVPPYTITCEDADTGQPVGTSNLCAGDYICFINDDEGCSLDTLVTVGTPTEITFEVFSQNVSCFGLCDGQIIVYNITGGVPPYDYAIDPSYPQQSFADSVAYITLCAEVFEVTITDDTDCAVVTGEIEIIEPVELVIDATVSDITCWGLNNGVVDVDYTGGTGDVYMFVDPPLLLEVDSILLPSSALDSLPPGSLTITIEDATGCFDEESFAITEPAFLQLTLTDSVNVGCGGDCDGEIGFNVVGGTEQYTYVLYPDPGLPPVPLDSLLNDFELLQLCAAADTLIIIDANGCTDTSYVTIDEPDPIYVAEGTNWVTCTGMCDGAATLIITGGTGELTVVYEPEQECFAQVDSVYTLCELCEGFYGYEVFDSQGCSLEDSILIAAELVTDMVLTTFSSPETCWNEIDGTATIAVQNGNPPITYQWDDPGSQTTATAVGLAAPEVYHVIVTDAIGCTLSDTVYVEPNIGCFFIATALTPNGDGVNDEWLIGGLEYFPNCLVQVFNRWGQLLFESRGYNAPWDGTFHQEKLPTADYYFIIDYSDQFDPITGTVTIKY